MIIYILELSDNKYYVGKTENLDNRIKDHFTSNGSAWTQKYRPLNLIDKYENCDEFDEDKYVKKYMMKYGIDNVRGGSYSQIELSQEMTNSVQRELQSASDKCFTCGFSTHFTKECRGKEIETLYNELNDDSDIDTTEHSELYISELYSVERYVSYYVKLPTLHNYYVNHQKEALTLIIGNLNNNIKSIMQSIANNKNDNNRRRNNDQHINVSCKRIKFFIAVVKCIKKLLKILDNKELDESNLYDTYDSIFKYIIGSQRCFDVDTRQFDVNSLLNCCVEQKLNNK